ncbi:DUF3299 domain-containing protein [Alcanivorax sp. MM125-6]|nr:DUF3299 domain-containing protein [Alcanivorax sp. MM125-6]
MKALSLTLLAMLLSTPVVGAEPTQPPQPAEPPDVQAESNVWDTLVPKDWDPRAEYQAISKEIYGNNSPDQLDDTDARAVELFDAMQDAWSNAPLRQDLDNTALTLPGFVVPLEGDDKNLREFLLVPYFGACIHFPPPPRNQVVLVKMQGEGMPVDMMWDAVEIEGTLKVDSQDTEYGTAGYVLEAESAGLYKGDE